MRVAFIGGTRFVGPVSVKLLASAGHEVCVAHSGAHEPELPDSVEHLHGSRGELLAPDGPVERWRPDALVDTFAGGASAEKALALGACATRAGAEHVVAISSVDVYVHCVEAGLGDGSGAVAIPSEPLPLREDASALRDRPYPGAHAGHDNVAMEAALRASFPARVTALRPGSIYGPHADTREWSIVDLVRRGVRRLELPDGGVQLFHRVAVERVGRAVVAALERAPDGFWACNVVDPVDWEYAGLAGAIARQLGWEWEPVRVPYEDSVHPWHTSHPVVASDERLRRVLGVVEPDPDDALRETVAWLWENREALAAGAGRLE
jgi:nucleoside-diphosphate-sugar epimerase